MFFTFKQNLDLIRILVKSDIMRNSDFVAKGESEAQWGTGKLGGVEKWGRGSSRYDVLFCPMHDKRPR